MAAEFAHTAALAAVPPLIAIFASVAHRVWKALGQRGGRILVAWFVLATAFGVFVWFNGDWLVARRSLIAPVVLPSTILLGLAARRWLPGHPAIADLVAIQIPRLGSGVVYVALALAGALEPTFAWVAGTGDVLAGVASLLLSRRLRVGPVAMPILITFNAVGLLSIFVSAWFAVNRMLPWYGETGVPSGLGILPAIGIPLMAASHMRTFIELRALASTRAGRSS